MILCNSNAYCSMFSWNSHYMSDCSMSAEIWTFSHAKKFCKTLIVASDLTKRTWAQRGGLVKISFCYNTVACTNSSPCIQVPWIKSITSVDKDAFTNNLAVELMQISAVGTRAVVCKIVLLVQLHLGSMNNIL